MYESKFLDQDFFNSNQEKVDTSQKEQIRARIRKTLNVPIKFVQATGYFPFLHQKDNSVRVKYFSVPFLAALFQQIWQVLLLATLVIKGRSVFQGEYAAKYSVTEQTTFILMSLVVFSMGFAVRMWNLLNLQKIEAIWEEITIILVDIIALDEELYSRKVEIVARRSYRVCLMTLFFAVAIILRDGEYLIHEKGINESSTALFFISTLTDFASCFHVASLFLICYILTLLASICEMIQDEISKLDSFKGRKITILEKEMNYIRKINPMEIQLALERFLKIYNQMRHLVERIGNSVFKRQILAGIFCTSSIVLILGFFFVLWIDAWEIFLQMPAFLINITTFFVICERSTQLSLGAEKLAKMMQEVSALHCIDPEIKLKIEFIYLRAMSRPLALSAGHFYTIDRGFFIQVTSGLTTYLVILLQFRRGE